MRQRRRRNPTRGRHDTRQKGVCGARPVGVGLAVPCHLGACRFLEELVDIGVAQLATELVDGGNVNDHLPTVLEVDVLHGKIAATCPANGLLHGRDILALCGKARVVTNFLQRIQAKIVS